MARIHAGGSTIGPQKEIAERGYKKLNAERLSFRLDKKSAPLGGHTLRRKTRLNTKE